MEASCPGTFPSANTTGELQRWISWAPWQQFCWLQLYSGKCSANKANRHCFKIPHMVLGLDLGLQTSPWYTVTVLLIICRMAGQNDFSRSVSTPPRGSTNLTSGKLMPKVSIILYLQCPKNERNPDFAGNLPKWPSKRNFRGSGKLQHCAVCGVFLLGFSGRSSPSGLTLTLKILHHNPWQETLIETPGWKPQTLKVAVRRKHGELSTKSCTWGPAMTASGLAPQLLFASGRWSYEFTRAALR